MPAAWASAAGRKDACRGRLLRCAEVQSNIDQTRIALTRRVPARSMAEALVDLRLGRVQPRAGLRESQWDGAGSFGSLMRQLDLVDIEFDFQDDIAFDRGRMGDRSAADARRSGAQVPWATNPDDAALLETIPARLEALAPTALKSAAEALVKGAVAQSKGPVHLAALGQLLRRHLPQLTAGWAGAPTLAAFLHQLNIETLQRAMLDNSTTAVLYDPARHEPPTGMVGDRLVIGMLRAAELPEMRGADLVRILAAAQPHMGATESFEIAEVSRRVTAAMTEQGLPISARRVTNVLQAMIFGGLDAGRSYASSHDLVVAAMGVVLSAWARETQAQPDDEARGRLLAWLGPAP